MVCQQKVSTMTDWNRTSWTRWGRSCRNWKRNSLMRSGRSWASRARRRGQICTSLHHDRTPGHYCRYDIMYPNRKSKKKATGDNNSNNRINTVDTFVRGRSSTKPTIQRGRMGDGRRVAWIPAGVHLVKPGCFAIFPWRLTWGTGHSLNKKWLSLCKDFFLCLLQNKHKNHKENLQIFITLKRIELLNLINHWT